MDFIDVGSLLSGARHYVIPDYQREYSWGKTENETLWNDVKALLKRGSEDHFLGAIVTVKYSGNDSTAIIRNPDEFGIPKNKILYLLDGQQRITSLMLLFASIRECINECPSIDDGDKVVLNRFIDEILYDSEYVTGGDKAPRLFLKDQSGKYFCKNVLKISCLAQPDNRYRSVTQMKNAISVFKEGITECFGEMIGADKEFPNHAAFFEKLLKVIKAHAQLVDIRCEENMNEFQVFESLNGKGLNLTAIDRIKNFYFSKAHGSHVDANKSWNDICSKLNYGDKADDVTLHFFTTLFFYENEERISKVKLPETFKQLVDSPDYSFVSLTEKLSADAALYGSIRNAESQNSDVDACLAEIQEMGQEQIYVPLFAAAKTFGLGTEEFAAIAKALLVYIVRFNVCGKAPNTLDSVFTSIISEMKSKRPVEYMVSFIARKQEDDADFKKSFASYSTSNAQIARYYLKKIEEQMRLDKGDGSKVPDDLSLEHIIPQSINYSDWYGEGNEPDQAEQASYKEDVINRIGNMALLPVSDNSKASNKNYSTKCDNYINGSKRKEKFGKPYNTYLLIKTLVDNYDHFDKSGVDARAEDFSELAVRIWPRTSC